MSPAGMMAQLDSLEGDHAQEAVVPVIARLEGRRKKRRESANVFDFKKNNEENSEGPSENVAAVPSLSTSSQPLRSAAKRKMSVRDDEKVNNDWWVGNDPGQRGDDDLETREKGSPELVVGSPDTRMEDQGEKRKKPVTIRALTPEPVIVPREASPDRPVLQPSTFLFGRGSSHHPRRAVCMLNRSFHREYQYRSWVTSQATASRREQGW